MLLAVAGSFRPGDDELTFDRLAAYTALPAPELRTHLDILRGMNSVSVDLIYLDPPFNSKANYAAPIGSKAAGAAFRDTWTLSDVDVEWINLIEAKHPALYRVLLAAMTGSDKSYLAYMAARLIEMHRVLKQPARSTSTVTRR